MKEPTRNVDDLIAKGLQSGDSLTVALAKDLAAWHGYACKLRKGITNLETLLDKADRARRAGL